MQNKSLKPIDYERMNGQLTHCKTGMDFLSVAYENFGEAGLLGSTVQQNLKNHVNNKRFQNISFFLNDYL